MHPLKKIFKKLTGYWIYKVDTLPAGADFFVDVRKKICYKSIDTIFDVGANAGQTVEWLRAGEPLAKIYCFEPVSTTFKELVRKKGGDKNCILEQLALGDAENEVVIKIFEEKPGWNSLRHDLMNKDANAREEVVKVTTLDAYCARNNIMKIDLLKIDTEGFEINVLEGATEMLGQNRISMIYAETGFQSNNSRNTGFTSLIGWLEKYNFYFLGLYQLQGAAWKEGKYFGNALFVKKDVYKAQY